jgi:hypothetical protein
MTLFHAFKRVILHIARSKEFPFGGARLRISRFA